MKLNECRKKRYFDARPEPRGASGIREIARDEGGDMSHRGGK
jgi:hypothetical protein